MSLFNTGVRPFIDDYLLEESKKVRDYGRYWSASSAGYCQRKLIFQRLGVPSVKPPDARKTRVFESGKIFHHFVQEITQKASISLAQEVELIDDDLMVKGHFDDLVKLDNRLILYDYKTQNSRAFTYQKDREMSYYHRMQLGTYMYMLRKLDKFVPHLKYEVERNVNVKNLQEARTLLISKDDLRMAEQQLLWTPGLDTEIVDYWTKLNVFWNAQEIPPCTCADHENGFLAREAYNDYFYAGEPCSLEWFNKWEERK